MAEITLLMIAGDSGLVFLADQGASVLDRIFVVANQIARRPESMQRGTQHGQQNPLAENTGSLLSPLAARAMPTVPLRKRHYAIGRPGN
jgi:hypothetical protein